MIYIFAVVTVQIMYVVTETESIILSCNKEHCNKWMIMDDQL